MYIRASWYRTLLWIVIVGGVNCLYSVPLSCVFKTKETIAMCSTEAHQMICMAFIKLAHAHIVHYFNSGKSVGKSG